MIVSNKGNAIPNRCRSLSYDQAESKPLPLLRRLTCPLLFFLMVKSITAIFGFTVVTLIAYSGWAFRFDFINSSTTLYIACAAVFLLLGPASLYGLVRDECTRVRFYNTFFLAFVAYAISWVLLWQKFHDKFGEIFGSLIGITFMALAFRFGIKRPRRVIQGAAVLFFFHTAGYHLGELLHQHFGITHTTLARLGWGLFHGLGFGTGLTLMLQPVLSKDSETSTSSPPTATEASS